MGGSASKACCLEAAAPALPQSPWSDLPADLAGLVLQRLPSHADRARFASGCRHWRYAAKLMLRSPSKLLPPDLPWLRILDDGNAGSTTTFRSLPDGELHRVLVPDHPPPLPLLSCDMGWLLFKDSEGQHYLENPLSGAVLTLPNAQCKDASSSSSSSSSSDEFQIRKLACTVDKYNHAVVAAALISHDSGLPATVACCRPGKGSDKATTATTWSTGSGSGGARYEDMAVFKGRAYAVTTRGDLYAHDFMAQQQQPGSHVIVAGPAGADSLDGAYANVACGRRSYLAASARGDKLRLVRWIVPYHVSWNPGWARSTPMAFKVFEAADMDRGGGRWVELERLDDDEALFVSADCSKAMTVSSRSTLSSNRIYFADCDVSWWRCRPVRICPVRTTCGVYDMTTKLVSPVASKWPVSDRTHAAWFFPFVDHSGDQEEEGSSSDKSTVVTWSLGRACCGGSLHIAPPKLCIRIGVFVR